MVGLFAVLVVVTGLVVASAGRSRRIGTALAS
jgi:hypothetical protein